MILEAALSAKTISRTELFRQVWETPMNRLAASFGLSGTGLAKICDRHAIPYPPRGYWAKKAAGKQVVQFRLPPCKGETPEKILIKPTPPAYTAKPLAPEQQACVACVKNDSTIIVSDRLRRPHNVVAGWLADHDQRRREAKLSRNPWSLPFQNWTNTDHRRHRILDALLKAAERHGLAVKIDDRAVAYFMFGKERIEYKLREKLKQVRRSKTPEQMRWVRAGDRTWNQILEPTGYLVFSIETYLGDSSIRRSWPESETQSLEDQLPNIVGSLVLAGPALVGMREQAEKAERRRIEVERIRRQEDERRRTEENRWRRFGEFAQRWGDIDRLRQFVTALEAEQDDLEQVVGNCSLRDWLACAHDQLERRDPLKAGSKAIFENIAAISAWAYRD